MKFVDLHGDTLLTLQQAGCGLEDAPGHVSLDRLRAGGALLQCFAALLPTHDCAEKICYQNALCVLADVIG